jgi:hypothetical protein
MLSGTICRNISGGCDLPEYCTGLSAECPSDIKADEFQICGDGDAYCYKNKCLSRDYQCQQLFGPFSMSSEPCYIKNSYGNRYGNCLYDDSSGKFTKCDPIDVNCGMLHCAVNSSLDTTRFTGALGFSQSKIYHSKGNIACHSVIFPKDHKDWSKGMVPEGRNRFKLKATKLSKSFQDQNVAKEECVTNKNAYQLRI